MAAKTTGSRAGSTRTAKTAKSTTARPRTAARPRATVPASGAVAPAIKPHVPAGAPGYLSEPQPPAQPPLPPGLQRPDPEAALDPGVFSFQPIRLEAVTEETEVDEGPRIPLFYIGETAYTVPTRPRSQIGFEMVRLTRTRNLGEAYDYLMAAMLGDEGWAAWCQYKGRITGEQTATIVAVCERLAVGALEIPKAGNA